MARRVKSGACSSERTPYLQILTKIAPPVGAPQAAHAPAPDLLELGPRLAHVPELSQRDGARRGGILTLRDQLLRALLQVQGDLLVDVAC